MAVLPALLAIALMLVAGRWFAERWSAVMDGGPPPISLRWLLLAGGLLCLHAFIALAIWRGVIRAAGAELSLGAAADAFIPSLLARYVPGKIWANTVRMALAKRQGVRYGASTGAILWETLVALGSAGLVAVVGLAGRGSGKSILAAVLLIMLSAGTWFTVRVFHHRPMVRRLIDRFASARILDEPASLAAPLLLSFFAWIAYGMAHIAIALAIVPLAPAAMPLMIGAVALAWAGGYLAVVMPVGLGVRDGIILITLASVLTPAEGIVFVSLSRAVQLAVDLLATAGWFILRHGPWTPASPAPSDGFATPHLPRADD